MYTEYDIFHTSMVVNVLYSLIYFQHLWLFNISIIHSRGVFHIFYKSEGCISYFFINPRGVFHIFYTSEGCISYLSFWSYCISEGCITYLYTVCKRIYHTSEGVLHIFHTSKGCISYLSYCIMYIRRGYYIYFFWPDLDAPDAKVAGHGVHHLLLTILQQYAKGFFCLEA